MNKFTNDKKIVVAILVIFFIAIGFLFIKGEVSLQKASRGYDIVAFENTKQKLRPYDLDSTLSFYVQNLNKGNEEYEIAFFINNQIVSEKKEQIKSGQEKIINPTQEITEKINNINSGSCEYKIQVTNNNEKKTIYKQIII